MMMICMFWLIKILLGKCGINTIGKYNICKYVYHRLVGDLTGVTRFGWQVNIKKRDS